MSKIAIHQAFAGWFSNALCTLLACAGLAQIGCSTEEHPCYSNDDCPSGYTCDRGVLEGICIQEIYVFRCGQSFCQYPYEKCVDDLCVERTGLDDWEDTPPKDATPHTVIKLDSGVVEELDAEQKPETIIYPTPLITIEQPISNSLITDQGITLSGQVFNLHESAQATYQLDHYDPRSIELDSSGRFIKILSDLKPGRHEVIISVQQGDQSSDASVNFRLDYSVKIQSGQLTQNGNFFRFIGLDVPDLLTDAWAYQTSQTTQDRVKEIMQEAVQMGVTVIRTRAYDDRPTASTAIQRNRGNYSEIGLQALDYIIEQAGEYGIKLILPLVGGSDTYGGVRQYLLWHNLPLTDENGNEDLSQYRKFFTEDELLEHYKEHILNLLTRKNSINSIPYNQDLAILAWEIIDAPQTEGIFVTATGEEMNAFYSTMAHFIHSNDNTHLVGTGEQGFDTNHSYYNSIYSDFDNARIYTPFDGTYASSWRKNLSIGESDRPGIDYGGIQLDPREIGIEQNLLDLSNLGADWITGHAQLAALVQKPLVVSAARIPTKGNINTTQRRQILKAWIDESTQNRSSLLVGNFYSDTNESRTHDDASWCVQNGTEVQNSANIFGDLIRDANCTIQPSLCP